MPRRLEHLAPGIDAPGRPAGAEAPADPLAPSGEPPSDTEPARSPVGWALTAITFLVLAIGVAIIRQLSEGGPRVSFDPAPGVEAMGVGPVSSRPEAPRGPLVLRPIEPGAGDAPAPVAPLTPVVPGERVAGRPAQPPQPR